MEYILDARNYLPKFLKDSPIMMSIMDCLNILISDENEVFEEIQEAYNDMLYKVRDYSKLSYGAKIEIIKELGFDYVLDIMQFTSEQLTELITFFNLIYILKGKKPGLKLVLDLLEIDYDYIVWDETEPQGPKFTAQLIIRSQDYNQLKLFGKIKNFTRAYMLPWIDVTILIDVEPYEFYIAPLWGAVTEIKDTTEHNVTIS